jgi:hypothetical protein
LLSVCTLAPAAVAGPGSAHSSILAFAPLDFFFYLLLLPSMAGLCSLGALIAHIYKESFVVTFVLAL